MTVAPNRKRFTLALVGLLVVLVGWFLTVGLLAKSHLNQAQSKVSNLHMSDLLAQPKGFYANLESASSDVAQADNLLGSPIWSVASHIPFLGRSIRATRVSSTQVHTLLDATLVGTHGLKTFVHNPKKIIDPALVAIVVNTVDAVTEPAHAASQALNATDLRLVPGAIANPIRKLQGDLNQALPFLDQGQSLVSIAPVLLGTDKPRNWLLVMGNGAEARSIGGLPGGLGILQINRGKLALVHQESNDGISQIRLKNWQSLVAPDVANLYHDDLSRFTDVNQSPDFPTSGKLMEAMYEQYSGKKTDGILFADEHTLAGLMQLTGPIIFRGKTFTSDNVSAYIGRGVYADYSDPKQKDRALLGLSKKIFDTITTKSPDLLETAKTILSLVAHGRFHVWARNAAEQKKIVNSPAGGSMLSPLSPKHMVVLVNGAGNKIDAYVHSSVTYVQGKCQSGAPFRTATIKVSLHDAAPKTGLPTYVGGRFDLGPNIQGGGSTNMLTYVHVPLGSTLLKATYGGKPINLVNSGTENNRTVWRFDNVVAAQSSRTLAVTFTEYVEPDKRPELLPQPMANDMRISIHRGSKCTVG